MKHFVLIISLLFLTGCAKDPAPTPSGGTGGTGGGGTWTPPSADASMYTNFSEDWDNWRVEIPDTIITVRTSFSEDWDNWDFSLPGLNGDIRTSFSEDWDNWSLITSDYTIQMRTSFSENWDNWDIDDMGSSWHAEVQTSFSEDWDNWDVFIGGTDVLDMNTNFSEDFDQWRGYGEFVSSNPIEYRLAVLFIPVFISALHQQGIIE